MFLIFYGKIEKKISINKEDFLHREEERMKEPVLIVMAAGMGSRYGGLKADGSSRCAGTCYFRLQCV